MRVCLTLVDDVDFNFVKDSPFSEIHLDKPIYVGNIPIKHFGIYLLSATIVKDRMDAVVSPKNKYLEALARKNTG